MDVSKPESKIPWLHMVVIGFVYALTIFGLCAWVNATFINLFYVAYTMLVSALLVFGAWAALGSAQVWIRVPVFTLLG